MLTMFTQKLRVKWLRLISDPHQAIIIVTYTVVIPALVLEKVGAIPFWAFFLSFIPWLIIGIGYVTKDLKQPTV